MSGMYQKLEGIFFQLFRLLIEDSVSKPTEEDVYSSRMERFDLLEEEHRITYMLCRCEL